MTGILKRPDSEPNQLGSHTLGTVMKNTAVHKLFSLVWPTQITNGFIVISFSMIYFPVVDIWAMQILNRSVKCTNSVLSYVLSYAPSAWSFPCHPQHISRTHFSTPVYTSSATLIEREKSWKMSDLKTKYLLEFYVGRWHSKPQSLLRCQTDAVVFKRKIESFSKMICRFRKDFSWLSCYCYRLLCCLNIHLFI